jgi:hypothetical protein
MARWVMLKRTSEWAASSDQATGSVSSEGGGVDESRPVNPATATAVARRRAGRRKKRFMAGGEVR